VANKTEMRNIVKDMRRQLRWIEDAIKNGTQEEIDQLAMQLSATAISLESESNY
jgi:hypothetical protein